MGVCVFLLNIYRINGLLAKLFAVYGFCHIKLVYFVRRLAVCVSCIIISRPTDVYSQFVFGWNQTGNCLTLCYTLWVHLNIKVIKSTTSSIRSFGLRSPFKTCEFPLFLSWYSAGAIAAKMASTAVTGQNKSFDGNCLKFFMDIYYHTALEIHKIRCVAEQRQFSQNWNQAFD